MVSVNLVANTNLQTPEEFRRLVVKEDKGVVVRLSDIADVVLGAEDYDQEVRFNGQAATFMGIWVLPTANSLDVVNRVREEMKQVQAQLPAGMTAGIPYDSTRYIDKAISEVLKTLTETLIIVIIVIFLFLGSFRSVLIPIVAIPISLIGAVFLMLIAGFTINLLTLLAIVLSVALSAHLVYWLSQVLGYRRETIFLAATVLAIPLPIAAAASGGAAGLRRQL